MSFLRNLKVALIMIKDRKNEKLALTYQSYPKEDYPIYRAERTCVCVHTLKKGVKIL